jgi:hypothetical protein
MSCQHCQSTPNVLDDTSGRECYQLLEYRLPEELAELESAYGSVQVYV